MKTSALLLLFTFGCSVDSTGLLPEDGGPPRDAGTRDASVDALDQPDAFTSECSAGETLDCLSVGVCVARQRPCIDGSWGACEDNVNGGMPELCNGDGLDENCDGVVNEGCECTEDVTCGKSNDAPCTFGVQRCVAGVLSSVCEGEVSPVDETCNDFDDDCDGEVDEEVDEEMLNTYYADTDLDGYGIGDPVMACAPPGEDYATRAGDCDDGDGQNFPDNAEVCDDRDNNCNSMADEDLPLTTYFFDDDEDTYGDTASAMMLCISPGDDYVTIGDDCLDDDATINPGAEEECDLIDNDCSGTPDDDEACRAGCIAHTYNEHVYQFCQESRSFWQARDRCDDFGGSDAGLYVLATINDEDENDFLDDTGGAISASSNWWIGLTDSGASNEGTFRWLSGEPFSYENWDSDEPNDDENTATEDCAELRASGRWNDARCNSGRFYICEEIDD
ncbi:MAG: MopE-related protein [Polyangiales bacterium]